MDIKERVAEIAARLKHDKDFSAKFHKDPAAAIESAVGVRLPHDQVNAVIASVKAKLATDHAGDLLGSFKKLF